MRWFPRHRFRLLRERLRFRPVQADDEPLGLTDIAELLGVWKRTALDYTKRDDFPQPILTPRAGRLWARKEVEEWAAATLPLPRGRPPKGPRKGK